jgi:hypothetical protein
MNNSMNWLLVPDEDPIKIKDVKELNIIEYYNAVIHKLNYLASKFEGMKK